MSGVTTVRPRRAGRAAWVAAGLVSAAIVAGLGAAYWRSVEPESGPTLAPAGPGDPRSLEALKQQVQRDPNDGRNWALLAYAEFDNESYEAAAAAFEKALAVSRKVALDPGVWCDFADALGMAQGGSLAGRPTELVLKALALRPGHVKALEMAGSAAYEQRDFAGASAYWRRLLVELSADSPQHRAIVAAIERADRLAATSLPPKR